MYSLTIPTEKLTEKVGISYCVEHFKDCLSDKKEDRISFHNEMNLRRDWKETTDYDLSKINIICVQEVLGVEKEHEESMHKTFRNLDSAIKEAENYTIYFMESDKQDLVHKLWQQKQGFLSSIFNKKNINKIQTKIDNINAILERHKNGDSSDFNIIVKRIPEETKVYGLFEEEKPYYLIDSNGLDDTRVEVFTGKFKLNGFKTYRHVDEHAKPVYDFISDDGDEKDIKIDIFDSSYRHIDKGYITSHMYGTNIKIFEDKLVFQKHVNEIINRQNERVEKTQKDLDMIKNQAFNI